MGDPQQYPVFIPIRDRLSCLLELLAWLEAAGQREIWLIDNDSTYAPLLQFLEGTQHHVVRTGRNMGHRSPWLSGTVQRQAHGRYFIVTDPDVVPDPGCPPDVLQLFRSLLDEYPHIDKAGFGLRTDDLPECYALRADVVDWERPFWVTELRPGILDAPPARSPPQHAAGGAHRVPLRGPPPAVVRRLGQPRRGRPLLPRSRRPHHHQLGSRGAAVVEAASARPSALAGR